MFFGVKFDEKCYLLDSQQLCMRLDDAPQFVNDAEQMVALDLWILKNK